MRSFVAILVIYGNLVVPWQCCCDAAAFVRGTLANSFGPNETGRSCCCPVDESGQPISPSAPPKPHCPYPTRAQLLADQPLQVVERPNTVLLDFLAESTSAGVAVVDPLTERPRRTVATALEGPALRTADRMLRFHHRFRC